MTRLSVWKAIPIVGLQGLLFGIQDLLFGMQDLLFDYNDHYFVNKTCCFDDKDP
jgi:hypothetical protein